MQAQMLKMQKQIVKLTTGKIIMSITTTIHPIHYCKNRFEPLKVLELLFHFKGCVDELPTDYDKNRCDWKCANWAGKGDGNTKNYCEDNWSQHQHCSPNTNGLIKDYCKFSCTNCGKIKKSVIS